MNSTPKKAPQKRSKGPSGLELTWDALWLEAGPIILQTEYRFHSTRRWRLDRADLARKIAIELEGGGGRHHTYMGHQGDCEKYNQLTALGWKLYRFTAKMLADDPEGCIDLVLGEYP